MCGTCINTFTHSCTMHTCTLHASIQAPNGPTAQTNTAYDCELKKTKNKEQKSNSNFKKYIIFILSLTILAVTLQLQYF